MLYWTGICDRQIEDGLPLVVLGDGRVESSNHVMDIKKDEVFLSHHHHHLPSSILSVPFLGASMLFWCAPVVLLPPDDGYVFSKYLSISVR